MTLIPPAHSDSTDESALTHQQLMSFSGQGKQGQGEHVVQLYDTDSFLLDAVSDFIGSGLGSGASCIVIATPAHREELQLRLLANGIDISVAHEQDRYVAQDAAETLAQFLVDGTPDPQRFVEVIGSIIERAGKGQKRIHIFGEMVALLWQEGNQAAALRLEELWNELRGNTHPFVLLCAYPMSLFAGQVYSEQFMQMCGQHSHVVPDEHYTLLSDTDAQLRAVSLFQQKALSLEAEIVERKAAEERLRISENRYRRLFEASTDGILIVDPLKGTITDANPSLFHLLGSTREKILDRELWQVGLLPDQLTQQAFLRQVQQDRVLSFETTQLVTNDGCSCYVEWVGTLFQANGHEVLQCNVRDVTARVQAEKALRASEERFRTLADQVPIMIWVADMKGAGKYVNTAWCSFTGLTEQESLGTKWRQAIHPDDFAQASALWKIALADRAPYQAEFRLRRHDGIYRFVQAYGSLYIDSTGALTRYIGTIIDITEHKELEQQREAFISLVTHELKTPLTALQGNVQLSQRRISRLLSQAEQFTDAQQQMLEDVLTMLDRSQQQLRVQRRLINDLLDVSHIQADQLELHLASFDLVGLVCETVQDYQAGHPSRLITLDLSEQDPIFVYADRDRIMQVLSNYLTNALKFAPASEPVCVSIALETEAVRVLVIDQGPGLSQQQQEQVWKRFHQVAQTPVQNGWKVGLGLGLYICQQLISRQQGAVGVESAPGHGATFWFALPIHTPLASQ
jgi:PAS domain S-box-containing protein